MAYQNKTKHLKLPQWELHDKPDMLDFNRAFSDIDDAVNEVNDTLATLHENVEELAKPNMPQHHSLELLNGFRRNNAAEYFKTSDGIVTITFNIGNINGEIKGDHIIAILPEDFRPKGYVANSVGFAKSGGIYVPFGFWVFENGNLAVRTYESCSYLVGSLTYFAL